jgi:transposase-like protein
MNTNESEIFGELSQLITQYRHEVHNKVRSWPDEIKNRIIQLYDSGVSTSEISLQTGISRYTFTHWLPGKSRQKKNRPKRVCRTSAQFNLVEVREDSRKCVTATLPNGIKIDGVTSDFLLQWFGRGIVQWP